MVWPRGCFWFCIFVPPCGLSVPTAVRLLVLGTIREYAQRGRNAKESLLFSDAFPVMHFSKKKKKSEQVSLSLRAAGCHCYPAEVQVSGEPEGFPAVDLLNRFQEQSCTVRLGWKKAVGKDCYSCDISTSMDVLLLRIRNLEEGYTVLTDSVCGI